MTTRTTDIKPITGLRALSVIAVLLYHVKSSWLPGGFSGVDFFFVISGFVVCMSLSTHDSERFIPYIFSFYRRRITRLFPALYLFTLVTMLVVAIVIPPGIFADKSNIVGLSGMLGLSNFFLLKQVGNYFSQGPELNFFTHTWSLGIEEQYYFIFPTIGYFLFSNKFSHSGKRYAIFTLTALTVISLVCCALISGHDKAAAFYLLPMRFWELGAGALLFLAIRGKIDDGRTLSRAVDIGASALTAALIVAAMWLPKPEAFPWPFALLPVGAAVATVGLTAIYGASYLARFFSLPPLVYLGQISYSVYLWHWALIVLARWTVGLDSAVVQAAAIILSLCLGALSYHLVETPVRQAGPLKRLGTLGFSGSAAAAGLVCGLAALGLTLSDGRLSVSVTRDTPAWYPYIKAATLTEGSCSGTHVKVQDDLLTHVVVTPKNCSAPTRSLVVSVGDSHSGAYERMLGRIALRQNRPVELYETRGCGIFRFQGPDRPLPASCLAFRSGELRRLVDRLSPGDVLFLASLKLPTYRDEGEALLRPTADLPPADSFRTRDTADVQQRAAEIRPFLDKGVIVVVEDVKPVMKSSPFTCADWYTRIKPYCAPLGPVPRAEIEERAARAHASLALLARLEPRIKFWRPIEKLCDGAVCPPFRDGKPLYFDSHHLSGYGDDVLLDDFGQMLLGLGDRPASPSLTPAEKKAI